MVTRAKSLGAALGAAVVLTVGVVGPASADPYVWQSYTRDSTWNCGPAGSTVQVGNLYLLPCLKIVYGDWQPILIVTATSSSGTIYADAEGAAVIDGKVKFQDSSECTDAMQNQTVTIPAHTSLACFSPTVYTPYTEVEGEFAVSVNGVVPYVPLNTGGKWTTG